MLVCIDVRREQQTVITRRSQDIKPKLHSVASSSLSSMTTDLLAARHVRRIRSRALQVEDEKKASLRIFGLHQLWIYNQVLDDVELCTSFKRRISRLRNKLAIARKSRFWSNAHTQLRRIETEEETCSICLEDLEDDHILLRHLKCGSLWHAKCFADWFEKRLRNTTCPICRDEIKLLKEDQDVHDSDEEDAENIKETTQLLLTMKRTGLVL